MPRIDAYLFFNGNCADAMRFYERTLGGKLEVMMTHAESPMAARTPPAAPTVSCTRVLSSTAAC
jgi:PhnB protein